MNTSDPTGRDGTNVATLPPSAPLTAIRIDTEYLPGVVVEIVQRLGGVGEALQHACRVAESDDPASLAGVRANAADVARYSSLLGQIGWPIDALADSGGDGEPFDRALFADIARDSAECVADIARDPGRWADPERSGRHYGLALKGAKQALEQFDAEADR